MLKEVNHFVKKHQLIEKNSTIIVGVSGGPDSLALLHFLWNQKHVWNVDIVAAHVDHMFRGKESEEDLNFVRLFCDKKGITTETTQINVTAYQQEKKLSPQVAARECRYQFLDEVMRKYNANCLALGHHGDDQIETILMRLVRGSTMLGQAGIQVKRPFSTGYIIRPFLSVDKHKIEEYCHEHNLKPRRDPSNEKETYTRNRFRHSVLPFLKKENTNVHERFQHFSERLTEDEQYLEELTIQKLNRVIKKKEVGEIRIHVNLFWSMPKSLQRRGIHLILNYLYKEIPPTLSSIHIDNLLTLLEVERSSGTLYFPNQLRVIRSYDECTLTFHEEKSMPYCYLMDEAAHILLNNGNEIISEIWEHYPKAKSGNDFFIVDPDSIVLPLFVRSRKNGDKMTLKGMKGSKKVKDIFIDLKISITDREKWPIIEDSNGTIIWLPSLKKSSYEAADMTKRRYIVLQHRTKG